ncbi:MAG: gamma-glutamyltransferase [Pseudomonadota bacterium]|nr:gamma-glutamyltransferase [Pseudomonadota bacterium]
MAVDISCSKQPAFATNGMVAASHPLASAAGAETIAAGGNAIDAAVATLFTLTVVEPMMVGIVGGGMAHIRLSNGTHRVIDGLGRAPLAVGPDVYKPISDTMPDYLETEGRENAVGAKAIAVPGSLKAWCEMLERYGTLSLADVMEPAIRHASRGFTVTPYLSECIDEALPDLVLDPVISSVYLDDGKPLPAGTRLATPEYADTLRAISVEGPSVLYGGAVGEVVAAHMAKVGGLLTMTDFTEYETIEREVVRGTYRDVEIVGPPPPSSGGVHVIQMLNLLEGFDIPSMGFGSPEVLHLILEVLKIAFADRAAVTADPAFVDVPTDRLLSKAYADERRADIDLANAKEWTAGVALPESPNTTHVTTADGDGNIVAATQTINSTFGARIMIPDTGIVPNNYMFVFDPHPGKTLSIAPGKRVTTSMSPIIAYRDGKPALALGLPGGLRIFGSAMQALVNKFDHGLSVQEMVEAPRIWTQGHGVELEDEFPEETDGALAQLGHDVTRVPHVGGGMNAIEFDTEGRMTGASCWRADGTPVGLSGGYAREGARFWPDQVGR